MNNKCPGQDDRHIAAETIVCPDCGYHIEIFSDEIKVRCPKCKNLACRERLPTCVDWCKYAKECVGEDKYNHYLEAKGELLRARLIAELESYFGADKKRIQHAKNVLHFAEELLKREKADWQIVVAASVLHDVGIKAAEAKYGTCAGCHQEKEGPEIARKILLKIGMQKRDIEEICVIIAHHHSPGLITTQNFKVLYDADWLVNLKDEVDLNNKDKVREVVHKVFLTATGRALAENLYLGK